MITVESNVIIKPYVISNGMEARFCDPLYIDRGQTCLLSGYPWESPVVRTHWDGEDCYVPLVLRPWCAWIALDLQAVAYVGEGALSLQVGTWDGTNWVGLSSTTVLTQFPLADEYTDWEQYADALWISTGTYGNDGTTGMLYITPDNSWRQLHVKLTRSYTGSDPDVQVFYMRTLQFASQSAIS